jgi:outer membrane protein
VRIFKSLTVALIAICFSAAALAEGKIAVFNAQAAIMNTQAAKKALDTLKSNPEFAAMTAKFEALRTDMASLEKNAKTDGMTWTADEKADYRKKVEFKNADMKLVLEKLRAEEQAAVQRLMQDMIPKAKSALNQVVVAEGISVVIDSKSALYADPAHNITAKVTDKLNKAK